ncbi:pilin [Candidatus Gracilibacteria bacterium]|nr:pilin [Candidatus Gracilibacteria bacterium]MCF7819402.1 pilin [Candidatus Gracilibacteria bacterium]
MKKFLAPVLGFLAVLGLFAFDASLVFAQPVSPGGLIDQGDNPQNIAASTTFGGSFRDALRTIINYFLFFLGIVATIMVIYGGFMYVTSQGDDAQAEKGKNILMYAAMGIIIILISFALVNALISAGQGTNPTPGGA